MVEPREKRVQRSEATYARRRWPGALAASGPIFEMAQETRDIALDTRDSLFRIEELMERLVADLDKLAHPEAI